MTFDEYYELIDYAKNLFYVEFGEKINCQINVHETIEDYQHSKHSKKNKFIPGPMTAYDFEDKEINVFAFNANYLPRDVQIMAIMGTLFQNFYHYIMMTKYEQFFDIKKYLELEQKFEINEAIKVNHHMYSQYLKNIMKFFNMKDSFELKNSNTNWVLDAKSGYSINCG